MRMFSIFIFLLCFMAFLSLPPLYAQEHKGHTPSAPQPTAEVFSCPMHPHITADHATTCPICGMTLQPVKKQSAAPQGGITLSDHMGQLLGVQTARVTQHTLGQEIRGYGRITENLSNRYNLATRVSGWVDTMGFHGEGEKVKKGAELLRLYSPELVAAQQDFLSALTSESPIRKQATQKRLKALGMQPQTIKKLIQTRTAFENVPFYAPYEGYISHLGVHNGSAVQSGQMLLTLDNLTPLWIEAGVGSADLPFLQDTPQALVTLTDTGKTYTAEVLSIIPMLEEKTRTGRIRLQIANTEDTLKVGQYADVLFVAAAQPRLAIPEEALLAHPEGFKVIIAAENKHFYPQPVTTGVRNNGMVEITHGLTEGDRVVTNGQFLIDADSNLKNAGAHLMKGGEHANH